MSQNELVLIKVLTNHGTVIIIFLMGQCSSFCHHILISSVGKWLKDEQVLVASSNPTVRMNLLGGFWEKWCTVLAYLTRVGQIMEGGIYIKQFKALRKDIIIIMV